MAVKPTYKELEQRVRELEEKVTAGQQIQKELRKSEVHFIVGISAQEKPLSLKMSGMVPAF